MPDYTLFQIMKRIASRPQPQTHNNKISNT